MTSFFLAFIYYNFMFFGLTALDQMKVSNEIFLIDFLEKKINWLIMYTIVVSKIVINSRIFNTLRSTRYCNRKRRLNVIRKILKQIFFSRTSHLPKVMKILKPLRFRVPENEI